MSKFAGRGLLLDIEGTTSSVRFVYDVLFPFARRELPAFLAAHWEEPELRRACELIAHDAGAASFAAWVGDADGPAARARVSAEVHRLMDGDLKATGLKDLQGLIWRQGYESGELCSHVYDDVPPALTAWQAAGWSVRIYSSGSIAAQRQFFAHTVHGDLTTHFDGHYDTTIGPKRAAASYQAIAADWGLPPPAVLFLSDVVAELDAARAAGMQTTLALRPGNAAAPAPHSHPTVCSFDELELA